MIPFDLKLEAHNQSMEFTKPNRKQQTSKSAEGNECREKKEQEF